MEIKENENYGRWNLWIMEIVENGNNRELKLKKKKIEEN